MFFLSKLSGLLIFLSFLTEIIIKSNELGVKINTDKNYINLNKIDIENENILDFHIYYLNKEINKLINNKICR